MTFVQTEDEAILIQKATNGHADSFGQLYEIHLTAIYQYIAYRVSSVHDAEDLTETVFLKAWQALESYETQKVPFVAWLYRIAHNTVIDFYRTSKESQGLETVQNKMDERLSVEQLTVKNDESRQLTEAMRKLSDLHQHVIVLRFLKGLPHSEVAEILGRKVEAVRVLQHRALKELQYLILLDETN
jgi:RNA polymerase sigma-70 factor (ECF subfamily)